MKVLGTLLVSLAAISCATASRPGPDAQNLEGVAIAFERKGALLDLASQRLAESGAQPVAPGEDYWLRLSNGSTHTIEIPTQSMYVTSPAEFVRVGPSTSGFAVKDSAVLVVLFTGFEGRYGFGHTSSGAYLPAGRSVLFQVPRKYLAKKCGLFVDFSAYTDEVLRGEAEPAAFRVSFHSSELP